MKNKIAATVGALSIAGLALAPMALADTAPPITPGPHQFVWANGQFTTTIAYDCGPDCFTMDDGSSGHEEFRFDGVRWNGPDGVSTADGITFINKNGIPATVS